MRQLRFIKEIKKRLSEVSTMHRGLRTVICFRIVVCNSFAALCWRYRREYDELRNRIYFVRLWPCLHPFVALNKIALPVCPFLYIHLITWERLNGSSLSVTLGSFMKCSRPNPVLFVKGQEQWTLYVRLIACMFLCSNLAIASAWRIPQLFMKVRGHTVVLHSFQQFGLTLGPFQY
jgi:hypothetical protein